MKHKIFETVLACLVVSYMLFYYFKKEDQEVLLTDNKCCAITINRTEKLITFTERDGDTIRRVLGPENEKELINLFMQYCIKNH